MHKVVWKGFCGVSESVGLLSMITWELIENAAAFSGLAAVILTSGIGNGWSSGPKPSFAHSWSGNWGFCRFFYSRSGFRFRSEFYFRIDIRTSTFPRVWPGDHGGGRSCTRTGHYGRRISFSGRWDETQIARQIAATYVTVAIGFHVNYRQIHQTST